MVKSADTADLKSAAAKAAWGFKSPSGHQSNQQFEQQNGLPIREAIFVRCMFWCTFVQMTFFLAGRCLSHGACSGEEMDYAGPVLGGEMAVAGRHCGCAVTGCVHDVERGRTGLGEPGAEGVPVAMPGVPADLRFL